MSKLESAYKTIGEVVKIVGLKSKRGDASPTHTIRYWEKEFKQIKPKKINKRRYYSSDQIEIIKMIKFLLKNKGMTISGVKNLLSLNINKLDDYDSHSLKAEYYRKSLKNKTKLILEKINKIKNYGKKNSS